MQSINRDTAKPFSNFEEASRHCLKLLHARLGFQLWMVTRTEGDDWTVIFAEDHGYGVKEGLLLRWSDSFCSRMVQSQGPQIAPDVRDIPTYLCAPVGQQLPIQAYVGVPLTTHQGSLFGTLCAIDPHPQPEAIRQELPLIHTLARLIATLLDQDLKLYAETSRAEDFARQAHQDALTGINNRRAWEEILLREEARCRRYGHPAAVLVIDLDQLKATNDQHGHEAGDRLLKNTSDIIRLALRRSDTVARIGGDEFAVLAMDTNPEETLFLCERLRLNLNKAGISASLGYAQRHPSYGLQQAFQAADAAMYADKRTHR